MTEAAAISGPQIALLGSPGDPGGTLGTGRKMSPREAAGQLESMFLSMLLKEMRQSLGPESSEGLFAGDSADVYGGLFDQFLGQHLANAGGVGLSAAWLHQLEIAQHPERPYHASPAGHGPNLGRSPPG